MATSLDPLYSIATTSLEGDLADKLVLIAESGFRGVDINIRDVHSSRLSVQQIKRQLDTLGLTPLCLQPLQDFTGVGDSSEQSERLTAFFAIMDILGTDLLLMTSTTAPNADKNPQHHQADLRAAAELAHAHQKRIGYEALAWGSDIYSYQQAWELVQQVNHPALGLIIDSFHLLCRNESLDCLRTIPAESLSLVHLSDAPNRDVFLGQCRDDVCKRQLADWSLHGRRLPGLGEFDLSAFYKTLADIGYKGPVSLEIFNDRHRKDSTQIWLKTALERIKEGTQSIYASPQSPPR